jgi:enoyl-CoA hydratase
MTSSTRIEDAGGILQITLCRPEQMNRVDDQLVDELQAVLASLRERPEIRAVVLAADGEVFSAGGDFDFIRAMHDDAQLRARNVLRARRTVDILLGVPQPIVAAIQGPAVGAGANIALACDLIVSCRSATIADPHARIGLVAGEGGCVWWPQSIGLHRARRHLLTGDPIDGETAFAYGLVTDLVDSAAEVLPAARALAAKIAALPPLSVQGTKRALNHIAELRAAEVLELSLALEKETVASEDILEAIAAFKERRPGDYRGV